LGDYKIDFIENGIVISGSVDLEDVWAIKKYVKDIGGKIIVEEGVDIKTHT